MLNADSFLDYNHNSVKSHVQGEIGQRDHFTERPFACGIVKVQFALSHFLLAK